MIYEVQFEVERVYYPDVIERNPGYMEFTAKIQKNYESGGELIQIFGKDTLYVKGNVDFGLVSGDTIFAEVSPIFQSDKYDLRLEKQLGFISATENKDLETLKEIGGVGQKIAEKIIEASYEYFHDSVFVSILKADEDIEESLTSFFEAFFIDDNKKYTIPKPAKILCNFINYVEEHREELMCLYYPELLTRVGMKRSDLDTIIKTYNKTAYLTLRTNPYEVLNVVPLSFVPIDNFAHRYLNIDPLDERRIGGAFRSVLKEDELRNKNIYTEEEMLLTKTTKYLKRKSKVEVAPELIIDKMEKEKALASIKTREIDNKTVVYLQDNYKLEEQVIFNTKNRVSMGYRDHTRDVEKALCDFQETFNINLNREQKESVVNALNSNISILTGGPGTGKSLTIKAINYVFKKITNRYVTLAAPTGKAARRMEEMTGESAHTLHRLYGIDKNGMEDKEKLRYVDTGLLIIDESSMIDLDMLYVILSRTAPSTRIVLAGDYDQLPSIGKGLVLRDLIDSKVIPTSFLKEVYRQSFGNNIIKNSQAINAGGKIGKEIIGDKDISGDFFVFHINNEMKVLDTLQKEFVRYLKVGKSVADIQVLTPRKSGILGSINVNRFLQSVINPKPGPGIEISDYQRMHVGDKVVQIKNNYRIGIMNGETGIYKGFVEDDVNGAKTTRHILEFNGEDIAYEVKELQELSLAYAITVHKSQGSEFDVCFFVGTDEILTSKNLLYTAVTRAKEKMYLMGDMNKLNEMIEKNSEIKRNSAIAYELRRLVVDMAA